MEERIGFLRGTNAQVEENSISPELGLLEYWQVLRKRRKVALLTGSLVALIGALVLFLVPWNYQSTARLELNFATASPLDALGLPSGAADMLGSNTDNEMGTEINALQGEPLMTKTINDLGLFLSPQFVGASRARENKNESVPWYARPKEREKELERFNKLLEVDAAPKSFNIDISFLYPDANVSQAVVNDLVSHYVEGRFQTRYETVMQTTRWLTEQLNGFKATVADSQRNLSEFMLDHQIIESSSQPSPAGTGSASASSGSTSIEVAQLLD